MFSEYWEIKNKKKCKNYYKKMQSYQNSVSLKSLPLPHHKKKKKKINEWGVFFPFFGGT